jgi:glycosyltransferase involved in cell wall biosynthesis
LFEYANQTRALARADVITVQSVEMREILLSKFGRELFPKIHCVPFPVNEQFYHLLDQTRNQPEHVEAVRRSLEAPKGRLLITIGHNGNPANNHLAIIEALTNLPMSVKSTALWVLPMAYQKDQSHIRECERKAAVAGLEFRIVQRYLDWQELAAFRIASDILIHLPVSDALSGTVLESVYAGNTVITGSWLPYSPFRKAGLPLITVENLAELPSCISKTLLRLDQLKREAVRARQRIREHFFAEATLLPWVEIYRRLLGLSAV